MVSVTTAEFKAPILNGGTQAPDLPGLGIKPDMDVIGSPYKVWK